MDTAENDKADWPDDLLVPRALIEHDIQRLQHTLAHMTQMKAVMAPAMVLFKDGKRQAQIMFRRFHDDASKVASFHLGFGAILAFDADAAVFFADSWVKVEDVSMTREDLLEAIERDEYLRPSLDPNRTEALTAAYIDRTLKYCSSQYPYARAGDDQHVVWQTGLSQYGNVMTHQLSADDIGHSGLIVDMIAEVFLGTSDLNRDYERLIAEDGPEAQSSINESFLAFLRGTGYVVSLLNT